MLPLFLVNQSLHTTYVPLHYLGCRASDGELQPLRRQRQHWRRRRVGEVIRGGARVAERFGGELETFPQIGSNGDTAYLSPSSEATVSRG